MPKKYVAKPASERKLYLNHFQDLDRTDLELGLQWNWEDLETGEASQLFDSEEAALEAMHDERLEWSYVNDDGYVIPSPKEGEEPTDELDDDEGPDSTEVGEVLAELRILQVTECSSMVSTWNEYLCLEKRDGRAVLSHRRYEVLGEVSDFTVETDDGDEEYRIPETIDGKQVVGTEDEFVMGGELTLDPADPDPEMDLAHADPEEVGTWLTERGFNDVWPGATLEGLMPKVPDGDEVEESEGEVSSADLLAIAQMAAVTHLRIRLLRWMDFPPTTENDYAAEVIKEDDKFNYRARGVTVPITGNEAVLVIRNPFLYYFSTALKLHSRIDVLKAKKI